MRLNIISFEKAREMDNNTQQNRNMLHKSKTCVPRMICIKPWNVHCFFKLIDDELEEFFERDLCCKLADKYLIAMAFTYFLRAALRPEEYTRFNFFVALYLAHDMEEDEDETRVELRIWANLANSQNLTPLSFLQHRDELWQRMEHRGAVSRMCCDKVMTNTRPFHKIWMRQRHVNHSGATRDYYRKLDTCPKCINDYCLSESSTPTSEYSPEVIHVPKTKRSAMDNGTAKKQKTEPCDPIQYT